MKRSTKGSHRDQAEKALPRGIKNKLTPPRPEGELGRSRSLDRERDILQAVMDGAGNSHLVYLDRNFNFIWVNEIYARTCGYKPEDMIGKNHFALYPHAENEAIFARVRDTGEPMEIRDKPFVFPDQPERGITYWDWTLTPVKRGGQVEGLVFSLYETTDRKRAEDSFRESEERFRSAFDRGAVPMVMTALDNRLIAVNSAFCTMLGYSETELRGMNFYDFTHPDDFEVNKPGVAAVAKGEKDSFRMEKRYIRKDGQEVWVDMSMASVRDETGKPLYFVTHAQDITERKRAVEQVRRRDEELQLLMNTVPALICYVDGEFRYRRVNEGYERWFGLKRQEIEGRHARDIIGEASWELVRPRMKRAMAGETVTYEEYMPYQKGGARWVEATFVPDRDAAGRVQGIVALLMDITARKQYENSLRESENRYRTLVDSAPFAVGIHRGEQILYANSAALQLLGAQSLEDLQNKTLFDLIHPAYHEYAAERIRRLEAGKLPLVEAEFEMVRLDGLAVPVEIVAGVVIEYEGGPAIQVTFRDVTDRKHMERVLQKSKEELETKVKERTFQLLEANKALSQSEEKYRELVESAQSIILRMDREGKITFFNEFAEKFFGYSRQEIIGRNGVGTIVPETESSGRDLKKLIKDIAQNPEKHVNNENENIRKNGERVWIAWTNAPIRDPRGNLTEILCVGNDLTERKKMEETLHSAQNKLRAMALEIIIADERSRQHLATDLHDTVVQMLGAAKLRSELLREYIPQKGFLYYTELQNLISQSLTQARLIMSEMSPPVLYELGFVPALEWLTEQMGNQYGISIDFQAKSAPPMIHEIQVMLFQSTRELLMNVVKHAQAKTAVVKLSASGPTIKIEVKDDGRGFDDRQAFRTDVSSSGFGLFSIRERLKHFSGELHITSKPGRGTKVTMTVPRFLNGNS